MHVVIRADGGPEIGYGHLVRSGALAEELLSRSHRVTYATTNSKHVREICPNAVKTVELPVRDNPTPFVEWLDTATPDIVFTDAYPIDTRYQRAVRNQVPLAVLQDDTHHTVYADVFVNPNLYAADLDYEFVDPEPRTCLGTDYVLLRDEISELAAHDPPWREMPERVIITMGGSDTADLTPTVIRAFDGCNLHVDAIVGPGFSRNQEREIRDTASDVATDVRVVRDPDDLPERMFQADFAVSTASTTTYELLALGTPIVSRPIVDNQDLIAAALDERNAATVLERGDGEAAFRRAIKEYATDTTLRQERQELGRNMIDGQGAERTADVLMKVTNE